MRHASDDEDRGGPMTSPPGWPAWASEPVRIVAPDPHWPHLAAGLITRITPLLNDLLDGEVAHIGSTAVPHLPAKPVLDLLAPTQDLDRAHEVVDALADDGWALVPPELDGRPWRRLFVLAEGDRRCAHLHLLERGHPRVRASLAFRDVLRTDPDTARRYARLKHRAARAHPDDREAYTAAKTAFIEQVLAERDATDG